MDTVKVCNWSGLSLSNNVPLTRFREVGPPRQIEALSPTSGRETPCAEALSPRGGEVVWPPTAPPPRVLLLPLLACSHVGEDAQDGIADLVRLKHKLNILDIENCFGKNVKNQICKEQGHT